MIKRWWFPIVAVIVWAVAVAYSLICAIISTLEKLARALLGVS